MTASGAFRYYSCARPQSRRQSPSSVSNTFLLLNNPSLTDTDLGEERKKKKADTIQEEEPKWNPMWLMFCVFRDAFLRTTVFKSDYLSYCILPAWIEPIWTF